MVGRGDPNGQTLHEIAHISHIDGQRFRGVLSSQQVDGTPISLEIDGHFYGGRTLTYRHYVDEGGTVRDVGVGIVTVHRDFSRATGRSLNLGTGPEGDFAEPEVFEITMTPHRPA